HDALPILGQPVDEGLHAPFDTGVVGEVRHDPGQTTHTATGGHRLDELLRTAEMHRPHVGRVEHLGPEAAVPLVPEVATTSEVQAVSGTEDATHPHTIRALRPGQPT